MTASTSSGKRNLLVNAAANWLGFAAQMAVAFVLSPLFVHGLGAARYGIWSLVESILAYLGMFDLGVAASVVRYVARFEAVHDHDRLNRIVSTSVCIFAVCGVLALAIALTIAFPLAVFLNIPADLVVEARWMLVLLGINLAIGLPLNVFSCVLDGLGRYPAKSALRTGSLVLRLPVFLLVLNNNGGLIGLACAITACNLVEYLSLAVAAHHFLAGLHFSMRFVDRETFRMIRGYSLHAFLAMLAGRMSFQTDALVIGAFLGPEWIAYFMIGSRLVEYAKNSLRAVTTVLTPAVSSLEARGDHAGIRAVLINSTRYVLWIILPIQAGLLLLGKPFLALWMGPDYARLSYPTLAILAVPLGLALSQSVSARILYGTGRLRWFARLVLAEAVANVLLSILLVRPYGIEGDAVGTAIPNVLSNLLVAAYVCRLLEVSFARYLWLAMLKPVCVASLLAAGWVAVVLTNPPTTWLGLLLTGAAGLAFYAPIAFLVEYGPRKSLALLRRYTAKRRELPANPPAELRASA
jgi:O-antigen/teichoic acid export membrane protein